MIAYSICEKDENLIVVFADSNRSGIEFKKFLDVYKEYIILNTLNGYINVYDVVDEKLLFDYHNSISFCYRFNQQYIIVEYNKNYTIYDFKSKSFLKVEVDGIVNAITKDLIFYDNLKFKTINGRSLTITEALKLIAVDSDDKYLYFTKVFDRNSEKYKKLEVEDIYREYSFDDFDSAEDKEMFYNDILSFEEVQKIDVNKYAIYLTRIDINQQDLEDVYIDSNMKKILFHKFSIKGIENKL